jgi:GntR family transcriptional regulator
MPLRVGLHSVVTMAVNPDAEIDHEGPVTPYRQLAAILRARIARGDWAEGRPIASENGLVQQYGLARSTVRRAIAVLVEDGDVWTVPGRGTFVGQPPEEPQP